MSEPGPFRGSDEPYEASTPPGGYGYPSTGPNSSWYPAGAGGMHPLGPPMLAREHPQGTTVLVLGILSLVVCPITGIFAITIGGKALKEIDAQPGAWTNRQSVAVGRVLGIVAVAVYGVAIAAYLVFVLVIVGMVGLQGH